VTTAEVALLISVLALLLAAASLGWQMLAFRQSGHNVKCVLDVGYVATESTDSRDAASTVVVPATKWATTPALREPGEQQFFVSVTNKGRTAVRIDSIGFTVGHQGAVPAVTSDPETLGLPCRLDARQTRRWDIPMRQVAELLANLDVSEATCTHADVQLGDGRSVRTHDGITVDLLHEVVAAEGARRIDRVEPLETPPDEARPA
jgi:hypothetical protein